MRFKKLFSFLVIFIFVVGLLCFSGCKKTTEDEDLKSQTNTIQQK